MKSNEAASKLFRREVLEHGNLLQIDDFSLDDRYPIDDWDKQVAGKIGRCHLLVVLIGDETGTSPGVKKELSLARSRNVPFFGVYISGVSSGIELPVGLARNRTINWGWEEIVSAVNQLMKEGKNSHFV